MGPVRSCGGGEGWSSFWKNALGRGGSALLSWNLTLTGPPPSQAPFIACIAMDALSGVSNETMPYPRLLPASSRITRALGNVEATSLHRTRKLT